ncbi:glycosyltransferase family 33 protein [Phycomyces blakesleeanus NRRL 1555(-)]|uniref:Chitobiosyldiphosphodolichol beta-mannosyltransferase n=1 Tax=Phycomyces blakesleeanus (strain ATCC 8743b / DSM 1359 / FGSC 10004 / NBRC 33097 / NRRL 1555) TaxID=763407 RepID=A0A162UR82_PHYB8|nr:glycosyltransferase family 33 protein [Phycomyces blakesleeanus NRRL 1555(-)]OAD77283.1 glycosyltransferase family 33 protein [Phycomyces blakesleeanus NRRL 1555(-)]|eukprot:XP_018295323.1 glycosyltransferase family 33 protein [Phycomyces blakesleeanus NRRL 1555(-)]
MNVLETWNVSVGGVLLVILCTYILGGKLLRLYLFDSSNSFLRHRPVVQVVVLGDIGRSPRMRSHAVQLADAGCIVDLIGYVETHPTSRITTHRSIRVRRLRPAFSLPEKFPKLIYILWAPFKAIWIALQLAWVMNCITQTPEYIFIQNPPAIPTLAIARWTSCLRGAKLVIDWHNFGYSILKVKLGQSWIVRIAQRYEQYFGNTAYCHLTVTDRMHKELTNWNVKGKIVTFKDSPPYHFKRLSTKEVHDFFVGFRLQDIVKKETLDANEFLGRQPYSPNETLMTLNGNECVSRQDRPKLIVSSTSWTEDEDFGLLLKAVEIYEEKAKKDKGYPKLLFVITGKGPLKSVYEERISRMKLQKTRVVTVWLESNDYPLLLGSADLGISLHTSSSGMDLPMKVVDMFGCGLPVCAVDFECLHELVEDGKNGLVFQTGEELAEKLEV